MLRKEKEFALLRGHPSKQQWHRQYFNPAAVIST